MILHRKVEVLVDGQWSETEMQHLHVGSRFRLTDDPMTLDPVEDGTKTYQAVGEPFQLPSGIWGIESEEVKDEGQR